MNLEQPERDGRMVEADKLHFGVILAIARRQWPVVLAGLVSGILISFVALHFIRPRYAAYLQLVPIEQSGANVSRNLSGLASLAGINLIKGAVPQFGLALETMKGRDVAEIVVKDTKLMARLFPDEWNSIENRWQEPVDPLRGLKDGLKGLLGREVRPWSPPDAADLQELLDEKIEMKEDQKRSIATISFQNTDPQVAVDTLNAVYSAADGHLRDRMDVRTSSYIDYLSRKLLEVNLAEHREALAEALADQERTLMMARSGQPFAADPLGVVHASRRPVFPNPALILVAGTAIGLTIGFALAWVREEVLRRRTSFGLETTEK